MTECGHGGETDSTGITDAYSASENASGVESLEKNTVGMNPFFLQKLLPILTGSKKQEVTNWYESYPEKHKELISFKKSKSLIRSCGNN